MSQNKNIGSFNAIRNDETGTTVIVPEQPPIISIVNGQVRNCCMGYQCNLCARDQAYSIAVGALEVISAPSHWIPSTDPNLVSSLTPDLDLVKNISPSKQKLFNTMVQTAHMLLDENFNKNNLVKSIQQAIDRDFNLNNQRFNEGLGRLPEHMQSTPGAVGGKVTGLTNIQTEAERVPVGNVLEDGPLVAGGGIIPPAAGGPNPFPNLQEKAESSNEVIRLRNMVENQNILINRQGQIIDGLENKNDDAGSVVSVRSRASVRELPPKPNNPYYYHPIDSTPIVSSHIDNATFNYPRINDIEFPPLPKSTAQQNLGYCPPQVHRRENINLGQNITGANPQPNFEIYQLGSSSRKQGLPRETLGPQNATPQMSNQVPYITLPTASGYKPPKVEWDVGQGSKFDEFIISFENIMGPRTQWDTRHMSIELRGYLKGHALTNYISLKGDTLSYPILKDRLGQILRVREFVPDLKKERIDPTLTFDRFGSAQILLLQLFFAAELIYKHDPHLMEEIVCEEFIKRLPTQIVDLIYTNAAEIALNERTEAKPNHRDLQKAAWRFDAMYVFRNNKLRIVPKCRDESTNVQTKTTTGSKKVQAHVAEAISGPNNAPKNTNTNQQATRGPFSESPMSQDRAKYLDKRHKDLTCFMCNVRGHIGYECEFFAPHLPPCNNCKIRHTGRTCFTLLKSSSSAPKSNTSPSNSQQSKSSAKSNRKRTQKKLPPKKADESKFSWSSNTSLDDYPHELNIDDSNVGNCERAYVAEGKIDDGKNKSGSQDKLGSLIDRSTKWFKDLIKGTSVKELLHKSYAEYKNKVKVAKRILYICESNKCKNVDHNCEPITDDAYNLKKDRVRMSVLQDNKVEIDTSSDEFRLRSRRKGSAKLGQTSTRLEQSSELPNSDSIEKGDLNLSKEETNFVVGENISNNAENTFTNLSISPNKSNITTNKIEIDEAEVTKFKPYCYAILSEDGKSESKFTLLKDFSFVKVLISIDGKDPILATIDTGAECSLLDESTAEKLNIRTIKSPRKVKGLGANSPYHSCKVARLRLSLEGKKMKSPNVLVIEKMSLPFPMIIGRDFLSENQLIVDCRANAIHHDATINTIDSRDFSYSIYMQKQGIRKKTICVDYDIPVYCAESIDLKADLPCKVKINFNHGYDLEHDSHKINTDLALNVTNKSFTTAPYTGLIDPSNSEGCQEIYLYPDDEHRLQSGDIIGHAYTVLKESEAVEALKEHHIPLRNAPTVMELDPPDKFEDNDFSNTPAELLCGNIARVYKPRDMKKFDEDHVKWLARGVEDPYEDAWTLERIKSTFEVDRDLLNDEQLDRFYKLIQKYRYAFVHSLGDVAVGSLGEVKIDLIEKAKPQAARPRRFPPHQSAIIQEKINDYIKYGVLEPGSGEWASPVHLVKRPGSDKVRLVCDLRAANSQLKDCRKYLRSVEENLTLIGPKKVFSKADLRSAYHMLNIAEPFRDLTAIITQENLYRFTALPFGLCSAVAVFELVMAHVFGNLDPTELSHYLDDFLCHSTDVESHFIILEQFLRTVVAFRMKLSPEKCFFFRKEMEYLGVMVSERGVRKSDAFCKSIQDAVRPTTSHQMMKFLGLINYQRRFIPGCSEIIFPLNQAIDHKNKRSKIIWSNEMVESFNKIKELMQNDIALACPDYSENAEPFRLYTDASATAVAASLCQFQKGELRVITHSSKSFNPTQLRWSTIDRELFALTWGIEHHRHFLISTKFTVFSDHKPLKYIFSMKHVSHRLARSLERIAEFDFEVEYVKGVDNEIADYFSRLSNKTSKEVHEESSDALRQPVFIPNNYIEIKSDGGGDSMFDSLHAALQSIAKSPATSSKELRELCIDEILKLPRRFEPDETKLKAFTQRIKSMRIPGVTPFLEVISACATVAKVKITLYLGAKQPLIFLPRVAKNRTSREYDPRSETIYIISHGEGTHYNYLVPNLVAEGISSEEEIPYEDENENPDTDPAICLSLKEAMVYDQEEANLDAINRDLEEKARLKALFNNKPIQTDWPPYNQKLTFDLSGNLGTHRCSLAHKKSDLILIKNFDEVCILFDTACSISTINQSAIRTLKSIGAEVDIQLGDAGTCIRALGDYEIKTIGVAKVNIPASEGKICFLSHTYLILDDSDMSQCILVGGDLLVDKGICLNYIHRADYIAEEIDPAHHLRDNCEVISLFPTERLGRAEIFNQLAKAQEINMAIVTPINNSENKVNSSKKSKRKGKKPNNKNTNVSPKVELNKLTSENDKSKARKRSNQKKHNTSGDNSETGGQTSGNNQNVINGAEASLEIKIKECLHDRNFVIPVERVRELQRSSFEIKQMIRYISSNQEGNIPQLKYKPFINKLNIQNEILLFGDVPVVDVNTAMHIICESHQSFSHCGRQKLIQLVEQFCWRPGMYNLIASILRSCPICQTMKVCTTRPQPPILKATRRMPFELLVADVVSLPRSSNGNTCALILCDYHTKWLRIFPMKRHTAKTTIDALAQYLASIPKCVSFILSDNAKEFQSAEFSAALEEFGIEHLFSSPWQPRTNGLAERSVQNVVQQLRTWSSENTDWDQFINRVTITHNHTYVEALGRSPASFIFEEPHKIPIDKLLPRKATDVWKIGNPNFKPYTINTEVLAKRKFIGNLTNYKLQSRYHGPYKIKTVRSRGVMYDLRDNINDKELVGIHYEDLRTFNRPENWLSKNKSFRLYFDAWWEIAFGEDDPEIGSVQDEIILDDLNNGAISPPLNGDNYNQSFNSSISPEHSIESDHSDLVFNSQHPLATRSKSITSNSSDEIVYGIYCPNNQGMPQNMVANDVIKGLVASSQAGIINPTITADLPAPYVSNYNSYPAPLLLNSIEKSKPSGNEFTSHQRAPYQCPPYAIPVRNQRASPPPPPPEVIPQKRFMDEDHPDYDKFIYTPGILVDGKRIYPDISVKNYCIGFDDNASEEVEYCEPFDPISDAIFWGNHRANHLLPKQTKIPLPANANNYIGNNTSNHVNDSKSSNQIVIEDMLNKINIQNKIIENNCRRFEKLNENLTYNVDTNNYVNYQHQSLNNYSHYSNYPPGGQQINYPPPQLPNTNQVQLGFNINNSNVQSPPYCAPLVELNSDLPCPPIRPPIEPSVTLSSNVSNKSHSSDSARIDECWQRLKENQQSLAEMFHTLVALEKKYTEPVVHNLSDCRGSSAAESTDHELDFGRATETVARFRCNELTESNSRKFDRLSRKRVCACAAKGPDINNYIPTPTKLVVPDSGLSPITDKSYRTGSNPVTITTASSPSNSQNTNEFPIYGPIVGSPPDLQFDRPNLPLDKVNDNCTMEKTNDTIKAFKTIQKLSSGVQLDIPGPKVTPIKSMPNSYLEKLIHENNAMMLASEDVADSPRARVIEAKRIESLEQSYLNLASRKEERELLLKLWANEIKDSRDISAIKRAEARQIRSTLTDENMARWGPQKSAEKSQQALNAIKDWQKYANESEEKKTEIEGLIYSEAEKEPLGLTPKLKSNLNPVVSVHSSPQMASLINRNDPILNPDDLDIPENIDTFPSFRSTNVQIQSDDLNPPDEQNLRLRRGLRSQGPAKEEPWTQGKILERKKRGR